MGMTIRVDQDLCEGNRVCVRNAPEIFQVGSDDLVKVLVEHPGEALRAKVQKAVDMCPRAALSIEDDGQG